MKHTHRHGHYLINLIFPAFVFGSVTGVLTATVVTLYKWCAHHAIHLSELGYRHLRERPWLIPVVLAVFFGLALLWAAAYKRTPNLRGGGIPTSIGILRGILPFRWLRNLVGIFFLSLVSFLTGVPLGNEGPSVQMGTAIGRGSVFALAKKHQAWDRYSMTGGACAGFSVATGAPISGMLFAIEEAHQRISPMILIVSATSVMIAGLTTALLAPLFGVSVSLFPELELMTLSVKDIWLPVVIGAAVGFLAVLFLKYARLIHRLFNKRLKAVPHAYKLFAVLAGTLLLGFCSYSFISTGHDLILELFDGTTAIPLLFCILLARATLTLSANANGITGGMFLPILALGATLSSLLGHAARSLLGLGQEYYTVILVLGITACISGMMKTPLTAIIFAVEALSAYGNILYIIVAAAAAFVITEIFDVKSINDSVMERRVKELNEGKTPRVIDTFVTVKPNAFAIGKQIRDIFWPANLFVLSVRHDQRTGAEVDEHGGKAIRAGDVLHVRYSTYDEAQTHRELTAIVGEQDYAENVTNVI